MVNEELVKIQNYLVELISQSIKLESESLAFLLKEDYVGAFDKMAESSNLKSELIKFLTEQIVSLGKNYLKLTETNKEKDE